MKEDNKMDLSRRNSANFTPNYLPSMRDANHGNNTEIADLKRQINELKELMRSQTNMSTPVDTDNQSTFEEVSSGVTFRDIQQAKNIYTVPSKNNKTRNQMFQYYSSHDSADMEKEVLRKIRQPLEVKYTRVKRKQVVQQPEELTASQTDSNAEKLNKEDNINKVVEEKIAIPSIQQENSTTSREQMDLNPKNKIESQERKIKQQEASSAQPQTEQNNKVDQNNQLVESTTKQFVTNNKQETIVENTAGQERQQVPEEKPIKNNYDNKLTQDNLSDEPSNNLDTDNIQESIENQQAVISQDHLSTDDNQVAKPSTNAEDMSDRTDAKIDRLDIQGSKHTIEESSLTQESSIGEGQSSNVETFNTNVDPTVDPSASQQQIESEKEMSNDSFSEQDQTNNHYKKSVFEYIWNKIK